MDGLLPLSTPSGLQESRNEGQLLGHTRLWRFAEKAVGAACWNVRFQLFRTVTFDTLRSFALTSRSGAISVELHAPQCPLVIAPYAGWLARATSI
jgi:hypothetical protein